MALLKKWEMLLNEGLGGCSLSFMFLYSSLVFEVTGIEFLLVSIQHNIKSISEIRISSPKKMVINKLEI